jgi:hypothetical protein
MEEDFYIKWERKVFFFINQMILEKLASSLEPYFHIQVYSKGIPDKVKHKYNKSM